MSCAHLAQKSYFSVSRLRLISAQCERPCPLVPPGAELARVGPASRGAGNAELHPGMSSLAEPARVRPPVDAGAGQSRTAASPSAADPANDSDEDDGTPEWILRATDRLAATIVSERLSGGESPDSVRRLQKQQRQKKAQLRRWLQRLISLLTIVVLAFVLAVVMVRTMAGPPEASDGLVGQLALRGGTAADGSCDANGAVALTMLQRAWQDSSELLRDAMTRGDAAANAAAHAQAGLEAAERARGEKDELLRLTTTELNAVKEV